jgi:hypothetical protein
VDIYTFLVKDFLIHTTRSPLSDTVFLYYSAFVGGDLVASRLISFGDLGTGQYSTVDYVPSDHTPGLEVVINDPSAKVAFNFQLVNAGNPPGGTLSARLAGPAQQLFNSAAGIKGAGATEILTAEDGSAFLGGVEGAALMLVFSTLWGWLSADCDGPVAVDQISGPRFVLDAWTDNPARSVSALGRNYPGLDSPHGCGGNSNYELNWSLEHSRTWTPVKNTETHEFISETGLNACAHNGAVHAFGVLTGGKINHTRTFTGATWYIDALGPFNLAALPVSSISFNDRLYVFGIEVHGSIACLTFTVDGTTWTPDAVPPPALLTSEPVAVAVFRHRLYMLARDSSSSQLHITSTSDLLVWNPWVNLPPAPQSTSPVAAATLNDKLFVFGVFQTGKNPDIVILSNSTVDGVAWSGWDLVEAGLRPEDGAPADYPLDVGAGIFEGRIYLVSRWRSPPPDPEHEGHDYVAVNFSEDGANWSGWRIPRSDIRIEVGGPVGLAPVDNHLYLFSQRLVRNIDDNTRVWAY